MEGVGARLGRSSTRYGPTTVFTGPVRKWNKKWVPVASPTPHHHHHHHHHRANNNNNNNTAATVAASHLFLYKWSPISQTKDDHHTPPPVKKFKYVPVAVLEEQKNEDMEEVEEEAKPSETDPSEGTRSKSDSPNGKPDINDVPMEDAQVPDKDQSEPQDLNESSLDLSLGLKGHDEDHNSDTKPEDQSNEVQ